MAKPRAIWLMVPATIVGQALGDLVPLLDADDIVIDGGNSYYRADIRRGTESQANGVHYLDVGTSGGVAGLDLGYCLRIGGETKIFEHLRPIFSRLSPGLAVVTRTPGRKEAIRSVEEGFLHCGPHGFGHFVKMVHNGIEYGVMAAYAEGLSILRNVNAGKHAHDTDAETAPLRSPEFYQYEMNLPEVTEVARRGSVISSGSLDLTATALHDDPELQTYGGHVSESGEGHWTIQAAIDKAVSLHVLSAALYDRLASRSKADFSGRIFICDAARVRRPCREDRRGTEMKLWWRNGRANALVAVDGGAHNVTPEQASP